MLFLFVYAAQNALTAGGRSAGSAFYAADKQERRAKKVNMGIIMMCIVVSKATAGS